MTSSWPETTAQASRQIALLVGYERTSALERRADRDATVMHGSAHLPASSVRADVEVAGWGASVRWR
jgi:hypothetical protein